jgi:hypothetical protein
MSSLLPRLGLALGLSLLGAFGCQCEAGGNDAGVTDTGRITTRAVEGGVELVLENLATPLRTLQVDVQVSGAQATALEPAGPVSFNVLEAALEAPRSDLTVVVADTRRLNLNDGVIALLRLDGAGTVTLSRAVAVDDDGTSVELEAGGS